MTEFVASASCSLDAGATFTKTELALCRASVGW